MKFLANLFGAGHEGKVRYALRKQKAVRWYRRALTVGDVDMATAERMLREADCSPEEAEAIYRLTSLCTFDDRFVIPPMHREEAIEMMEDPHGAQAERRLRLPYGSEEGVVMRAARSLRSPGRAARATPAPDTRLQRRGGARPARGRGPRGRPAVSSPSLHACRGPAREPSCEELYTRTFDLNPVCALEIGWHLFGEDYERGAFLVRMRDQLRRARARRGHRTARPPDLGARRFGRMEATEAARVRRRSFSCRLSTRCWPASRKQPLRTGAASGHSLARSWRSGGRGRSRAPGRRRS